MADVPVGLSDAEIIRTLATIEALAEVNNVPPPRMQLILDKARERMEVKPASPPGAPTP